MLQVKSFFDARTWTLTYVAWDPATLDAIVVDPVLDFDPATGKTWKESVTLVEAFVTEANLKVRGIFETHVHADHLTGAQDLKARLGAPIAIGRGITKVQDIFAGVFNLGDDYKRDGSQFDMLLDDGGTFAAGSLTVKALATPGHTPACMSYLVGDAVFTGDALFMPDQGVGRCDFPAGSAKDLYTSVHGRLYQLPPDTRVFVGHDYQPGGRAPQWETTIAASRAENIQLTADTSCEAFVTQRTARDATLAAPRLLLPSIQVNMNAGRFPPAEDNGVSYLKMPLRPQG